MKATGPGCRRNSLAWRPQIATFRRRVPKGLPRQARPLPDDQSIEGSPRIAEEVRKEEIIMSFGLYVLGYLIVIGGLTYGATLMHVPNRWIAVGAIVLVG